MKKSILVAMTVLFTQQILWAQSSLDPKPPVEEPIKIGQPAYGGTGCTEGTLQFLIQKQQFKLKFKDLSFNNPVSVINRKNCSFRLPLEVAAGYQMAIIKTEILGQQKINKQFNLQIDSRAGFLGATKNLSSTKALTSIDIGKITLNSIAPAANLDWSACGRSLMLEINLAFRAISSAKDPKQQALQAGLQNLNTSYAFRKCQ